MPCGVVPVVCLIASGNGTRRENHGDGVVGFCLMQCSAVQCRACSVAMGRRCMCTGTFTVMDMLPDGSRDTATCPTNGRA